MPQISLKLPEKLYRKLHKKKAQLKTNSTSDVIRTLLTFALEHYDNAADLSNINLQKQAPSYGVMTYCLLEKFLLTSVKNGQSVADAGHEKAEKIIQELLQQGEVFD